MQELGKKDTILGASEVLRSLSIRSDEKGRPAEMPNLLGEEKVICGYDQGLGERMIVCASLEDMQELCDAYAKGGALDIRWYSGDVAKFMYLIPMEFPKGQTTP